MATFPSSESVNNIGVAFAKVAFRFSSIFCNAPSDKYKWIAGKVSLEIFCLLTSKDKLDKGLRAF